MSLPVKLLLGGLGLFVVCGVLGNLIPKAPGDTVATNVAIPVESRKAEPKRPAPVKVETATEKKARLAVERKMLEETKREHALALAEEKDLERRGPKPVASEYDGITPEANAYLKANLKDDKSLDLVECSPVLPWKKDAWAQRVKYRAANSFGGKELQNQIFVIRNGEVTDVVDYRL